MEKKLEAQLDAESMTTVNVKEYAPSEAFSAEPPPAYQRPKSAAVQVARIAAVTVVLVSFILGSFIFAAAWVQANSACQDALNEQLARMDQMLEDRAALGPQYQALVGEPQGEPQGESDADQPQSASQHAKREEPRQDQDAAKDGKDDDDQQENSVDPPIHLKLPLQLDFDDLAGALMERNQRSRMNCVVEKRRAEEVVDHQPRTVRLPFGLNLTTDPRYEHVSGERMAIFCESGNDQRHVPMEQMGAPIVVQQQGPMGGSMDSMGPMGPMGPMQPSHQQLQQQMQQQHQQQMQQQLQQQIQMHLQQLHQQQMQRQHEQQMQQQQQQQQQHFGPPPQHMQPIQVLPMSHAEARGFQQHTPLVTMHGLHAQHAPQQPRQGRQFSSNPHVHLANLVPAPRGRGFQGQGVPLELRGVPVQAAMTVEVDGQGPPQGRGEALEVEGRSLSPEQLQQLEQLHQLQRLQPQDGPQILPIEVIEARAFQHPHEMQQSQGPPAPMPADTLRPPYQRAPIHAVPPQEDEPRPHFVQPRSVRSVDAMLHREKRVRRCACDCNC